MGVLEVHLDPPRCARPVLALWAAERIRGHDNCLRFAHVLPFALCHDCGLRFAHVLPFASVMTVMTTARPVSQATDRLVERS